MHALTGYTLSRFFIVGLWSNDFTSWPIHGGEDRYIWVSVEENSMQLKCMINYEELRIFTSWPIYGGEDGHIWVSVK